MNISKRELTLLVDSLRDFLKTFSKITPASIYRFPYRSPKLRSDLRSQRTISLLISITISLNTQIVKFVYRSDSVTTILASFPSKSLNYTAINLFLQKLSTLSIANFTTFTRTDITLQTRMNKLRAITMCSACIPDCGHDSDTVILFEVVYCPNTKCSGKFCLHKKTFQSLGRSDYQCPQCAFVCQVHNKFLKIKQIPFSCRLIKGFTFLKRVQAQFKMLLEMSIVLASIVPTERKVNLLAVR